MTLTFVIAVTLAMTIAIMVVGMMMISFVFENHATLAAITNSTTSTVVIASIRLIIVIMVIALQSYNDDCFAMALYYFCHSSSC